MPKTSMIRARVDPQLKDEAEAILQELGISTTQALTLFYQQVRLQRGIPFEVRLPDSRDESTNTAFRARNSTSFPVDVNRSAMEQNVEAYKAMHGELIQQHLGQYVALLGGQLVDSDIDPVALLLRVRERYPGQVIMRQKVEPLPERTLHVRHPTIEEVA